MYDKKDEKIINIFDGSKKHSSCNENGKILKNDDGFFYVCLKKDENGKNFDEEKLLDNAYGCQYIVKIMHTNCDHPHIYNYKVPGERLLDFIKKYINEEKEGKIIEVDKYYPGELA